jgi:hypothetical protein
MVSVNKLLTDAIRYLRKFVKHFFVVPQLEMEKAFVR